MPFPFTEHVVCTSRHTSIYLACSAEDAPSVIVIHGWPELSVSWHHQLPVFAAFGFRAIAPDMRVYGRSNVYQLREDYALEHTVVDMHRVARCAGPGALRRCRPAPRSSLPAVPDGDGRKRGCPHAGGAT